MAELFGPVRVQVEAASRPAQGPGKSGLSIVGKQPIDKLMSRFWHEAHFDQHDLAADG
jgi:hypothetical protein